MPEYHLPEKETPQFQELPELVQGYIEAMFFTNQSGIAMTEFHDTESQERIREGQADGGLPNDAGFLDLHPDSLTEIVADCGTFHAKARDLLHKAYDRDDYDRQAAGRDFWYTRNGHGVGFWDRTQLDADGLGEALSEVATGFGEVNPWFSDTPEPDSPSGYGYVYHSM